MGTTNMKLTQREEIGVEAGNLSMVVTFRDGQAVDVSPIQLIEADGLETVVNSRVSVETLLRAARAVKEVMESKGDYRGVCPKHGYLDQYQSYCKACEDERNGPPVKAPLPEVAPKPPSPEDLPL